MNSSVTMERKTMDTEQVEKIQKKVILEDDLKREQGKSTAKIILASVGGVMIGAVAAVVNYSQAATRELMNYMKEVATKRGMTPDLEAQAKLMSEPKIIQEAQQLLIAKGYPQRLQANMMPAMITGAVAGGFLMKYLNDKKQQQLSAKIGALREGIAAGEGAGWQERVTETQENTEKTR